MTDQDLIELWNAGSERAAMEIVQRHSAFLQRMAYRLGVREEVDELVQDTFVKAFNALGSFRGDRASLPTWLSAILRRLVLDRARADRRSERLTSLDAVAEFLPISKYDALDVLIAAESRAKILGVVRSVKHAELLRLRMSGKRWRSIATTLGENEATIKVRYHRMMIALREAAA